MDYSHSVKCKLSKKYLMSVQIWQIYKNVCCFELVAAEQGIKYLFQVVLPPLVTVGYMQGIKVLQGAPVISEGYFYNPFQHLVKLLLTLALKYINKCVNVNCGQIAMFLMLSYLPFTKSPFENRACNNVCEHTTCFAHVTVHVKFADWSDLITVLWSRPI